VIRFVARNWYKVRERKSVRLLDVGSGPGANTWFMAREGFSVSAIDGSARAIQLLQERLKREDLSADARVGNFVSLPWADASFDGAIDNLAICANPFATMQSTVREVHRVLKVGGLFLSASFAEGTWGIASGREVEPGGFTDVQEGPLRDRGFVTLLSRSRLAQLYGDFAHYEVDTFTWQREDGSQRVALWVTTCRK
jgi:SAM-dependent methyltransferase